MSTSVVSTPLSDIAATQAVAPTIFTHDIHGSVQRGPKGARTEDLCIVKIIYGKNGKILAVIRVVCDGHGETPGAAAAKSACDTIDKYVDSIDWSKVTPTKLKAQMEGLFHRINENIRTESTTRELLHQIQRETGNYASFDPTHGGTTVTIVFEAVCSETGLPFLLTAHAGDSDAFAISEDGTFIKLTAADHGIDSLPEELRIAADFDRRKQVAREAGKNESLVRRAITTYTGGIPAFVEIDGITVRNPLSAGCQIGDIHNTLTGYSGIRGYYRLNMTRTCGDFPYLEIGGTYKPSVSVLLLSPGKRVKVVLGSDGFGDVMYYHQSQKTDPQFSHFLTISEALQQATSIKKLGDIVLRQACDIYGTECDDITIVCGTVQSHGEYLAALRDEDPEFQPKLTGIPLDTLHTYDCIGMWPYDLDMNVQFPPPVVVTAPVDEKVEVLFYNRQPLKCESWKWRERMFECSERMFVCKSLEWSESLELESYNPMPNQGKIEAQMFGNMLEAQKRARANQYGKAPRTRTSLPRVCKIHRVNQPYKQPKQRK